MSGVDPINYDVNELRELAEEESADDSTEPGGVDADLDEWEWGATAGAGESERSSDDPTSGRATDTDDAGDEGTASVPEPDGAETDIVVEPTAIDPPDFEPGGATGERPVPEDARDGDPAEPDDPVVDDVGEIIGEVQSMLESLQREQRRPDAAEPGDEEDAHDANTATGETGAPRPADEADSGTIAADGESGASADDEGWSPWDDDSAVNPPAVGSSGAQDREDPDGTAVADPGPPGEGTRTDDAGPDDEPPLEDSGTEPTPSVDGAEGSLSSAVAEALDAPVLGAGPSAVTMTEDLGEKPFMRYVPAETEHLVEEWIDFLVEKAGTDGALSAIDSYVSAEWITVGVAVDLQSRVENREYVPGGYATMGRAEHLRSLQYIYKIT